MWPTRDINRTLCGAKLLLTVGLACELCHLHYLSADGTAMLFVAKCLFYVSFGFPPIHSPIYLFPSHLRGCHPHASCRKICNRDRLQSFDPSLDQNFYHGLALIILLRVSLLINLWPIWPHTAYVVYLEVILIWRFKIFFSVRQI